MGHFDVNRFYDKNSERMMLSKRIKQITEAIQKEWFIEDSEDTGDFYFRDGQYSFSQRNDGEWKPFCAFKDYWGYPECYCWFKQTANIPDRFKGKKVIYKVFPYPNSGWDEVNPQLILFINGKQVQGMDSNHQYYVVTDCAEGGEELEIFINAYTDPHYYRGQVQLGARLQVLDSEAEKIYFDILTPLEVANNYECDDNARVNTVCALNEACNLLDIDSGNRQSFHASVKAAGDYLDSHLYGKFSQETAWAIGHTHIDVAWLWRLRQTREKASRTFSTVLRLMDLYPEFKFMSSQAQLYDYVKKDYPELYERIKEKVKEGRWEVEGGMWVEADTNVASGEALIRQFIVGKRFFKDEFGVDNKIMWLPDVFGYSGALPQIIKKCGLNYFMTTKISWSEFNKFPYDTFNWRGIDGTEVLSHFSPCQHEVQQNPADNWQTTYTARLDANHLVSGYKRFSQKDVSKDFLITFGHGDGGGGPCDYMVERGRRMAKGIEGCPNVKISPAIDFYRHIEKTAAEKPHFPTWCGELYLEYHRGTLTAQARNKKYNRKTECLLMDAETLSLLANKKTSYSYPKERMLESWKTVLLNQFHDILPGSSIKEVYEDSKEQYESVLKEGCEITAEAQGSIISSLDLKNDSLVLFNTTGFNRKDSVVCVAPSDGDFAIFDGETEIPYQKTYDGKIVFVAEIPAKGYKALTVKYVKPGEFDDVNACGKKADTKFFTVEFNDEYDIKYLLHKKSGRTVAPEGEVLGKLTAYQDRSHHYEAWDVKCYYKELSWDFDFKNAQLIEKGAVRAVYKVDKQFRSSVMSVYYIVYNDLERIDIEYKTDWKERHAIIKADYPVDVNANKATFDIQFGNIERTTTENTTWDYAQFEVSMHKWADLSDNSFGLSVLNDCKYGVSVKDGHIRPTLLRCATEPNTEQDREYHEFTFSVFPHCGNVANSGVYNEAYNINFPVYAVFSEAHKGYLPEKYSLVQSDKDNIIIETVKKAEDSDDIVIRMYEAHNEKTPCTLTFGDALKSVSECNMNEENDVSVQFDGNTVNTVFKPFEIKTFKVKI